MSHPSGISDHSIGRWKNICANIYWCKQISRIAFNKFSDEVKICTEICVFLPHTKICLPGETLTHTLFQARETPSPDASPFQDICTTLLHHNLGSNIFCSQSKVTKVYLWCGNLTGTKFLGFVLDCLLVMVGLCLAPDQFASTSLVCWYSHSSPIDCYALLHLAHLLF